MNVNKIIESVEYDIAIDNFQNQHKKKQKIQRKVWKLTIRQVVVVLLVICFVSVITVQANRVFEEFKNRELYMSVSISDALRNGFSESIDMEYSYSDGIGLKINSLFNSGNDFSITFDFDITKKLDVRTGHFLYGYVIYDENNNVYWESNETNHNIWLEFCKEKKLKPENVKVYTRTATSSDITYTKENFVRNHIFTAKTEFPKSRKLYVRVVGVGDYDIKGNYNAFTNSSWKFEIDVPEKFYERSNKYYQLAEPIEGIKVEKIYTSDTSMSIIATIEGINKSSLEVVSLLSIVDKNGKEYKCHNMGFEGDRIFANIDINMNMATEELYLTTYVHGEEKTIKLIKQ